MFFNYVIRAYKCTSGMSKIFIIKIIKYLVCEVLIQINDENIDVLNFEST